MSVQAGITQIVFPSIRQDNRSLLLGPRLPRRLLANLSRRGEDGHSPFRTPHSEKPCATSHEALDRDEAFIEETRNASRTVLQAVTEMRQGLREPGSTSEAPRQK